MHEQELAEVVSLTISLIEDIVVQIDLDKSGAYRYQERLNELGQRLARIRGIDASPRLTLVAREPS